MLDDKFCCFLSNSLNISKLTAYLTLTSLQFVESDGKSVDLILDLNHQSEDFAGDRHRKFHVAIDECLGSVLIILFLLLM